MQFRRMNSVDFSKAAEMASQQSSASFHWTRDMVLSELSQHECFAAFDKKNEMLGFLVLAKRGETIFEVPLLVTSPLFQKQGVMHGLMLWLFASFLPGSELWLEVHEKNSKACNLYRKLGFQEVGRRAKYYQDGAAALLFTKYF